MINDFHYALRILAVACLLFASRKLVIGAESDAQAQVIAREKAWSRGVIQHDPKTVASILADDFIGIDGRGFISDKSDELKEAEPPEAGSTAPQLLSEDLSDFKVRIYGDTAVVTCTNTAHFRSRDEKQSEIKYRRTTVWVRQSGDWRCVSFHGSRILEPRPSPTPTT